MKADLSYRHILNSILLDESVRDTASDDGFDQAGDYATFLLTSPDYIVLVPDPNVAIIFRRQNEVCYEMHAAFVAGPARKKLREFSVKALKWLFENTRAESIISMIPSYHEASLMYAKVGGMTERCELEKAFLKNGKLHSLVVLDMSKERFYQLHGEG